VLCAVAALSVALAGGAAAGCGGKKAAAPGPGGERQIALAGGSATVPPSWEPLDKANLALVEGAPDAGLRRRDGTAILSVRRGDKPAEALGVQEAKLLGDLRPRVPGLRGLRAADVQTRAGRARSFVVEHDGPTGLARVVVVPDGDQSYVLELAITSTAGTSAREAGRIIRSFDTDG
jgi:hypothetical protein